MTSASVTAFPVSVARVTALVVFGGFTAGLNTSPVDLGLAGVAGNLHTGLLVLITAFAPPFRRGCRRRIITRCLRE